ncbi:MAG: hypothetical protein ABJL99_14010 [Aliishimia sp.]
MALITGIILIFAAWMLIQIGKGILFAHSGFDRWDDSFLATYYECCLITDLRTAVPVGLLGVALLGFAAWKFLRG